MFGDILMWVLTVFGLFPLLKVLFGPKKTFQEQLAEYSDDIVPDNDDRLCDDGLGLGESHPKWNEDTADHDASTDDEEVALTRFLQGLGECGDEYRRFSMLEDFGNSRTSLGR